MSCVVAASLSTGRFVGSIAISYASPDAAVRPISVPTEFRSTTVEPVGAAPNATAGFVDPGFSGHVTLELSNVATLPITLWPGMKIGQLCFFRLSSAAQSPYGTGANQNRYQGQRGPTASRAHRDFHLTRIER